MSDKEKQEDEIKVEDEYAKAKIVAPPKEEKKDVQFTPEQMQDYIERLKDENAKRRIKASKLEEDMKKLAKMIEDEKTEKSTLAEKLSEYEKAKKEAELAEKSENEKLRLRMTEIVDKYDNLNKTLSQTMQDLKAKDMLIQNQEREKTIDKLVRSNQIEFASEFEREGFLNSVMKRSGDDFELNNEELAIQIKEFAKNRRVVPKTPQAGPSNKTTEMPVLEEAKVLLAKRDLTFEEQKRLDTILAQIG